MKKSNSTQLRKNIVSKKILLPLGALTIIVISGLYFTQQHEGQNASRRSTAEPVTAIPAGLLTLQDVESRVATKPTGETRTIAAIELGNEDGILVYKVRLSDNTIRYINALTGMEAHYSHDSSGAENNNDNDESTLPAGFIPDISFAAARDAALASYSNSEIKRIKLKTEDGIAIYSVRFSDKHRVNIDAQSGAIVKIKQTNAERKIDDRPNKSSRSDRNSHQRDRMDDNHRQTRESDDTPSRTDSDSGSRDDLRSRESDDAHNSED